MLFKLFTFAAVFGIALSGYGWRHEKRHHHESSSSEEKFRCPRLHTFNLTTDLSKQVTEPKIAYFSHQGQEKAIVVCENRQLEVLLGFSKNANADTDVTSEYNDVAVLAISTMSGLVLDCHKRHHHFEAFNLVSQKTDKIQAVACLAIDGDDIFPTLQNVSSLLGFQY